MTGKWDELELRGLKRHPVKSSIQVSLISQQTHGQAQQQQQQQSTVERQRFGGQSETTLTQPTPLTLRASPALLRFIWSSRKKGKSKSGRWMSGVVGGGHLLWCRRGTLMSATAFAFNYEIIHTAEPTVSNENRWRLALAALTPLYFNSHFVRCAQTPLAPLILLRSTPFRIGSWHVSANDPTMGCTLTLLTQLNCRPTYTQLRGSPAK